MVKDGGLRSLMYGHSHALASVVWALAKSEYDPGSQWISQYLYISRWGSTSVLHTLHMASCQAYGAYLYNSRWGRLQSISAFNKVSQVTTLVGSYSEADMYCVYVQHAQGSLPSIQDMADRDASGYMYAYNIHLSDACNRHACPCTCLQLLCYHYLDCGLFLLQLRDPGMERG
jgi:hypothetical protein